MPMKKKAVWAGIQSGQIRFFTENPQGNVNGLQGSRKFHVTDQLTLVDDNGTNVLEGTSDQIGTESAGAIPAGDQTGGQAQS